MIKMAELPQMLTPKDVAELLCVHPKTVHIWLRAGKLKGIKISYRAWRIPKSSLDLFVEQNSNVSFQNARDRKQENTEDGSDPLPTNIPKNPLNEDNNLRQGKMKHYIRDIMGEQASERTTE